MHPVISASTSVPPPYEPVDMVVAEPYAYVGPESRSDDPYWNYPFGAARTMRELAGGHPDAVLEFFLEGRKRAG